ncbi:Putative coat protein [Ornithinibacillus halophilus]|uniref:Putative coat protein n=2 Tax=Ornithinibacillus halophilus TaxID=930117 RepID=A0A1M5C2S5_9BACI|nr:Putative coat protein [Ornithinibacillus halophilus]
MHPKVAAFKEFINKHPKLRQEIRKNGRSWQEYYEKWVLLGEDDPMWEQFHSESDDKKSDEKTEGKSELFSQLLKLTENVDIDKVQKNVQQLSGTIGTIQEMLSQYQENKNPKQPRQNDPFSMFRD